MIFPTEFFKNQVQMDKARDKFFCLKLGGKNTDFC